MAKAKGLLVGGTPAPNLAPIKGALLEDDSVEGTALNLIMQALEYQQKQQLEMMQTFQQSLTAQASRMEQMWAEFDVRMNRERQSAIQGIEAMNAKLEQLLTSKQTMTPEQIKALEGEMTKEALKKNEQARLDFLKYLESCPKGEINNQTGEVQSLSANGVKRLIPPGRVEVEAPFVDLWEEHLRLTKQANDFADKIKMKSGRPMDANRLQALKGQNPIWHQDFGRGIG